MEILKIKTENRRIGDFGEKQALRYLRRAGYKIVKRGYVAAGHEIDLIAENRSAVVFVEVKTRSVGKEDPRTPRPASAVTPEKQRSIIAAAKYYLAGMKEPKPTRLDVIEVYVTSAGKRLRRQSINHIENAFNYNTAHPTRFRKD